MAHTSFPCLSHPVLTFPVTEEKGEQSGNLRTVVTMSGRTVQPKAVVSSSCYVHLHKLKLLEEPYESAKAVWKEGQVTLGNVL